MSDQQADDQPRPGDEEFARTAGEMLRASAGAVDAATAARLNRGRQAALDRMTGSRRALSWGLPALATAAVAAVALALWVGRGTEPPAGVPAVATVESAEDLDLLLAGDSLEMLEDLEFYAWLDASLSDAELSAELESAG